jgi:hypothetical protein
LCVPVEQDGKAEYVRAAAQKLNLCEADIQIVKILSKKLDARDQEQFYYDLSLAVHTPAGFNLSNDVSEYIEKIPIAQKAKSSAERPVVIGFGPAGMFATLELIASGLKPIIFERGKRLEERSLDVQLFMKERVLDPESNIQFGEGGAGSYSDGKLFSRKMNTDANSKVLETLIKFGAPEEIEYISKPHLGTDVLCGIVRNIRNFILSEGGEIHYRSKMTDMLLSNHAVVGVVINHEKEYPCSNLFVAVGHSSRDTFEMLHNKGARIEQKPIAVGVRVEHPVEIINQMRYGEKYANFSGIGAATYSLNYTDRQVGRGVNTFCMCPGGEVINASTEDGMLLVNGMSYSRRASAFSNAALVVSCKTEDYGSTDPLAGIAFQKELERRAFLAGGGRFGVPAQTLLDFLSNKSSGRLNMNSCATGTVAADLHDLFPTFVSDMLVAAFRSWEKAYPTFISSHALLMGAETRTSAPIRIVRSDKYESVSIKKLYPIGEGSGYAGGITSSAADAVRAVQAVVGARA